MSLLFINSAAHRIRVLDVLVANQEISKCEELQSELWYKSNKAINIIQNISEKHQICNLQIDLICGGIIYFSYGQLHVDLSDKTSLFGGIRQLLYLGYYFVPDQIISFCLSNPGLHNIEFVQGKKKDDISDEFLRIYNYTKSLDEFYKTL